MNKHNIEFVWSSMVYINSPYFWLMGGISDLCGFIYTEILWCTYSSLLRPKICKISVPSFRIIIHIFLLLMAHCYSGVGNTYSYQKRNCQFWFTSKVKADYWKATGMNFLYSVCSVIVDVQIQEKDLFLKQECPYIHLLQYLRVGELWHSLTVHTREHGIQGWETSGSQCYI